MTDTRNCPHLILACTVFVLFISGCQPATSVLPSGQVVTQVQTQPSQSANLQQAMTAIEGEDYPAAVKYFQSAVKRQEPLPQEALYFYGIALSRTGDYPAAIEIQQRYLLEEGNEGEYLARARQEIRNAEASLQQQQQQAERAAIEERTYRDLQPELEANWINIQASLAAQPAAFTEPKTGIEMLLINGGCYQMGDQYGNGNANELPVHEVCVDDFYLGKYEVTQAQWQAIMGHNPAEFQQGDNHPVEMVSWQDAVEFTRRLSGTSGSFRLPTEAEWEYAARSGGKKQQYSGGEQLDALAWNDAFANDGTHPVGQKQPNGLGLYDMTGNVYEWCLDRYAADYYQHSPKNNPTGPETGDHRVRRGGSWSSEGSYQRTSFRNEAHETEFRVNYVGLRLVLPRPQPK